jgi:hypothetical protein
MSQPKARRRGGPVRFRYFEPEKRRATQYEEVTLHTQWDPGNFATQGWFNRDAEGRGSWTDDASQLRATDWWAYRDPNQEWFRPFVNRQAGVGDAITLAVAGGRRSQAFGGFTPGWVRALNEIYGPYRFAEYGLFLSLCQAQREARSDVVGNPIVFQSLEKDRHAQDIALYAMELEKEIEAFDDSRCRGLWMESPLWQPARKWVEHLLAARDWGEINFAINLVYDPLLAAFVTRDLLFRSAPHHGDAVTPVLLEGAERDRELRSKSTAALVRFLIEQDPNNRETINAWIERWAPGALEAVHALAPGFEMLEHSPLSFEEAYARVTADWNEMLAELGLRAPEGRHR